MISLQNQLRAFEFLKCHDPVLAKQMHLHGPYICQYGIILNYPPFGEYDDLMQDIQSKYFKVISLKEAAKSKVAENRKQIKETTPHSDQSTVLKTTKVCN